MVKRIVLTGGPCAGKTTILSKIEQDLCEKGYKVFVVRESATELISGGITPHDSGVGMKSFQKLILMYQYQKEEIYNRALADTKEKDVVIIYDRGLLDNRAYINNSLFNDMLYDLSIEIGVKLDEVSILNRYDMVIHLVTSAGNKGYSLENNKARYESENEAILLDRKILSSWIMHDNLQIVDSTDNFDEKINKVLSLVHSCLGEENRIKIEKKFIVDLKLDEDLIEKLNAIEVDIEQYYIETMSSEYECRLRKVDSKLGSNYYYILQHKDGGVKRILTERKISEKEFNRLMQFNIVSSIKKKRYSFVYENKFYKLDLFSDGLMVLEVGVDCYKERISFPDEITVIEDVTNDTQYNNINYGTKINQNIKKRELV